MSKAIKFLWVITLLCVSLLEHSSFLPFTSISLVNADTENACMVEYWWNPVCTANDAMSELSPSDVNLTVLDPCDGTVWDTTTLSMVINLNANSSERFNVWLWFWSSPSCTVANLASSYSVWSSSDQCGDIPSGITTNINIWTITVSCTDSDWDGKLDLPYIISWQQKSEEWACTMPSEAIPWTTSKCKNSSVELPIFVPDEICDGTDNDSDGLW